MRFGAFVPQGWRLDLIGIDRANHWGTMKHVATRIEETGFESLWVYDHFHTVPQPTQEATYEAWTLMAAPVTLGGSAHITGRARFWVDPDDDLGGGFLIR